MEPYKESVRDYIEASRRLLQSTDLSQEDLEIIRDHLDAIDEMISSQAGDIDVSNPDNDSR